MLFVWLVPWWLWVPYLVLWLYVMVTLILEDREPADTLAWAFALLLLPVVGIIFYFFAGRDWAAIDAKKGSLQGIPRQRERGTGPVLCAHGAGAPALREPLRGHLRQPAAHGHPARERVPHRHGRYRRDLRDRVRQVRAAQGRPLVREALHPHPVLHLGGRRAHRRAHRHPARARSGRRRGALPLRLPGQQGLGQEEAPGARAARREGGRRHDLALADQLPRPPQDRRHRRRDRLHRRLQRRPGVRRRRQTLRALARHAPPRHRAGRRRAPDAVRAALVRESQGGPARRAVPAGAAPGAPRAACCARWWRRPSRTRGSRRAACTWWPWATPSAASGSSRPTSSPRWGSTTR